MIVNKIIILLVSAFPFDDYNKCFDYCRLLHTKVKYILLDLLFIFCFVIYLRYLYICFLYK